MHDDHYNRRTTATTLTTATTVTTATGATTNHNQSIMHDLPVDLSLHHPGCRWFNVSFAQRDFFTADEWWPAITNTPEYAWLLPEDNDNIRIKKDHEDMKQLKNENENKSSSPSTTTTMQYQHQYPGTVCACQHSAHLLLVHSGQGIGYQNTTRLLSVASGDGGGDDDDPDKNKHRKTNTAHEQEEEESRLALISLQPQEEEKQPEIPSDDVSASLSCASNHTLRDDTASISQLQSDESLSQTLELSQNSESANTSHQMLVRTSPRTSKKRSRKVAILDSITEEEHEEEEELEGAKKVDNYSNNDDVDFKCRPRRDGYHADFDENEVDCQLKASSSSSTSSSSSSTDNQMNKPKRRKWFQARAKRLRDIETQNINIIKQEPPMKKSRRSVLSIKTLGKRLASTLLSGNSNPVEERSSTKKMRLA